MIAISAGVIGFWMRKLFWYERILAVLTGLCLIYPENISDIIGLVSFAIMFSFQIFYKGDGFRKRQNS